MPTRKSSARWEGGLKSGKGTFNGEGGSIGGQYNFSSRFEEGTGSNPEELLAAAEAACYSMALAGALEANGTPPTSVDTTASCTVERDGPGFRVSRMHLDVTVVGENIDDGKFQEIAKATLQGCPVSKALHGNVEMSVDAKLGG